MQVDESRRLAPIGEPPPSVTDTTFRANTSAYGGAWYPPRSTRSWTRWGWSSPSRSGVSGEASAALSHGRLAATLGEAGAGFLFTYDPVYLRDGEAVSLTLPVRPEPHAAPTLFPFFYGLLAEGSTREVQHRVLKIDEDDDFGLLLATGADVIGSVSVEAG